MSDIHIRPIHADDESTWRALWDQYIAFYQVDLADEISAQLFQRLIAGEPHFAFLAELNGKVIGFVHGLPHASTWTLQQYCYLEDLFVAPAARGSGAARALINAIYDEADKRDCVRVYWHTDRGNVRARKLYDKVATLSDFVQYRRR